MNTLTINGYINNYGFCCKKSNINKDVLTILMTYFNVKPILQYDENEVINDFFKPVKSTVIDDDLFDNLFNLVSKNKSK